MTLDFLEIPLYYLLTYLSIFTIIPTIAFEFLVYSIFIRKNYLKLLGYAALINAFTWPLANLFLSYNFNLFWGIEILVFLVEIPLIKLLLNMNWKKAIIISGVANLVTVLVGFFLMML